jgi:hypothetical protein
MKTVLKGVKITLEIESVEVDDTNGQNSSINQPEFNFLADRLAILIKQLDEIKETIAEKL